MKYRSLNESIMSVTNPQPELTQNEYIELLESALISIAEELECDVEDLVEAATMTPARSAVLDRSEREAKGKITRAKRQFNAARVPNSPGEFQHWKSSNRRNSSSGSYREAESRIKRIKNLRAVGSLAKRKYGKYLRHRLRTQHHADKGMELIARKREQDHLGRRGPTRKQINWAQRKTANYRLSD